MYTKPWENVNKTTTNTTVAPVVDGNDLDSKRSLKQASVVSRQYGEGKDSQKTTTQVGSGWDAFGVRSISGVSGNRSQIGAAGAGLRNDSGHGFKTSTQENFNAGFHGKAQDEDSKANKVLKDGE